MRPESSPSSWGRRRFRFRSIGLGSLRSPRSEAWPPFAASPSLIIGISILKRASPSSNRDTCDARDSLVEEGSVMPPEPEPHPSHHSPSPKTSKRGLVDAVPSLSDPNVSLVPGTVALPENPLPVGMEVHEGARRCTGTFLPKWRPPSEPRRPIR
jgi:hypothetical protein